MNTHELIIKGDTNDGDYEEISYDFNLNHPRIFWNENAKYGFPKMTLMQISENLKIALMLPKETKSSHNWSRLEYDSRIVADETIAKFIFVSFGVDIFSEDFNERFGDYQDILDEYYDKFGDFLPMGEFGIHTIENIKYAPLVKDVTTIFDNDVSGIPEGTQYILHHLNSSGFYQYDDELKIVLQFINSNWFYTTYKSIENIVKDGAKIVWIAP